MDEGSNSSLLPQSSMRTFENRAKNVARNRSASALIYGLVAGFICSLLMAYTGVVDEGGKLNFEHQLQKNEAESSVEVTKNLAEFLHGEVRVLCAVMTDSNKLNETGHIVMDTWGKRCNKILFFSEAEPDRKIENVVVLKEQDETKRLREAFEHIHKYHRNDFDWVIKVTKNAFVVLENLRHLLYQHDTKWPVAIGQRFLNEGFRDEYVISKKTLKLLVEKAFKDEKHCRDEGGAADIEMTKCMESQQVVLVESVDEKGRAQFFNHNPELALFPAKTEEYDTNYRFKLRQGLENCCSDRLAVLGNYWNSHLYYLEYFIYKVHAFGRHRLPEPLPKKLTLEKVIKDNE